MDLRRLGSTDLEITPIGLGCLQFAGTSLAARLYGRPVDQDTATSVVKAALDGGITWFDTAEMYGRGHSERTLTSGLRACGVAPGDVRIATKWLPMLRTARSIGKTIGDRLDALQGYPIDLHQIHLPTSSLSSHAAQLKEMAALLKAGKIKSVGVSNFSAAQMAKAHEMLASEGIALATNQLQINMLHRDIERDGVLDTARRLGITLIAHTPLASGLLTGKFHDNPELVRSLGPVRRRVNSFSAKTLARTAPLIRELREVARGYGVTPTQVALNWLIHFYGDTVVVIPGASKPQHAEESSAAMSFRLTDKELTKLDELSRN
jgi:aryl-alcohol dehydrogenase-like predicted oxidoreductase